MSYILNNLHFMFVHFPIALLIVSFIVDVLALLLKKKEWHVAGFITLLVGTLGAIAAVITGPENERNPLLHTHELFAQLTMLVVIVLSLVRLFFMWKKSRDIGSHPAYLAAALVGVLLVSYTGHLGGEMVHKPRGQNSNYLNQNRESKSGQRSDSTKQPADQGAKQETNQQSNQQSTTSNK